MILLWYLIISSKIISLVPLSATVRPEYHTLYIYLLFSPTTIFLNCWPENRAKIELMTCKNLTKTREISDLWSSQWWSEVVEEWILCWISIELDLTLITLVIITIGLFYFTANKPIKRFFLCSEASEELPEVIKSRGEPRCWPNWVQF